MDSVATLLLAVDVGERTLAMAQRLVHQVTQGLAPAGVLLLRTDGLRAYLTALVTPSGQGRHPARRQGPGPRPTPRWQPGPGRRYAQGVQSSRRRRLGGVTHRIIFGAAQTIESILATRGGTINTRFGERLHLDFHQHGAAIGRRVNT